MSRATLNLSSANALNLDQPDILSFDYYEGHSTAHAKQ